MDPLTNKRIIHQLIHFVLSDNKEACKMFEIVPATFQSNSFFNKKKVMKIYIKPSHSENSDGGGASAKTENFLLKYDGMLYKPPIHQRIKIDIFII